MGQRKLKVILVEDDEDDFIITRDLLSEIGKDRFDLEWVNSFGAALETMGSDQPDVYLVDYHLGEHSGMEFLREAMANGCRAPVILLTGRGNHEVDVEAMKAGAADYLIKGHIDPPSLERSIRYAVERKQAEARLAYMAQYDYLTGLANRTLLMDRLTRALARAERSDQQMGLLFLDLDRLKDINDTLGHDVGDRLLKDVAGRLSGCVRKVDTVARLGGDEFAIVLEGISHVGNVTTVAQKILDVIAQPFTLNGQEVFVTVSIGITVYPFVNDNIDNLLKDTDAAMYSAKKQGGNCYRVYTSDMNAKAFERLSLETSLRHALERKELVLYYQPKMNLSTGKTSGMEALLRWNHPEMGLVPPDKFIPIAEETGLIVPIGEWVVRTACAQNRAWQDAGLPPLRVAVNLSARQCRQKDLVETISLILKETGMEPHFLELELTEGVLIENTHTTNSILTELRDLGVQISIDDFGTGYSSLSYLRRLPINTLKIDISFIRDITADPDDGAIATAIIALAHSLRLKVVAEGVETEAQLTFLRDQGCDDIQGFLFSRPISAEAFERWLRENET